MRKNEILTNVLIINNINTKSLINILDCYYLASNIGNIFNIANFIQLHLVVLYWWLHISTYKSFKNPSPPNLSAWNCSWLSRYEASSESSAISASCRGDIPEKSFISREAPAPIRMQQIVRLLYAAALCKAVCPFSLSTISKIAESAWPIKNLTISLCPNLAP